ncbi:hypothetical protein KR009_010334 [Drosophila setifemur]|nr:hypothetical protein KR009_010334 [Drosophila setifemur]
MPLDQVIISYVRNRNWINVLLLRSMNLYQSNTLVGNPGEMVEVSPNGISWYEQSLEYRILLDKFFEISVKSEEGEPISAWGEMQANHVAFGLGLRRISHRLMDPQTTTDVELRDLRMWIDPTRPFSLHCRNCANEVIGLRQFVQIQPLPVTTMQPQRYFSIRSLYPREDQLFYGLNYLIACPEVIGSGVIYTRGLRRLNCSRCTQCFGRTLGQNGVVQLYADALVVLTGEDPPRFREIFCHVTATQMMLRLLHDADPISPERTRLFLMAQRPDGQLQYLQMLIDTHQVHLLRSKLVPSEQFESGDAKNTESESSSESDFEMKSSDSSSNSPSSSSTDVGADGDGGGDGEEDMVRPVPGNKITRELSSKSVRYVVVNGFRGCRLNYVFSGDDGELSDNYESFLLGFEDGARMLRISYAMMSELIGELNANEHLVASLEMQPPPTKTNRSRLSYIIYETDEDFYQARPGIRESVEGVQAVSINNE